MNKKDLEQKVLEINQKLQSFGDLNVAIQEFNTKKQVLENLINDFQGKKPQADSFIDALPQKQKDFQELTDSIAELKTDITQQIIDNNALQEKLVEVQRKSEEIQVLSLEQLGKISNEKLSNSFDKVKDDLKNNNGKWFWWLFGTSILLLLAVIGIVVWQTGKDDTIFEISFLVKIALTSPIIFFEIFVANQYSRSQRLIEEYEFKVSIARSLEAYKEIIVGLFTDKEGDEFKKKLDFILEAIGKLYSSPMSNIKKNETKEASINKRITPVLSDIKDIVSDVKNIVSKS